MSSTSSPPTGYLLQLKYLAQPEHVQSVTITCKLLFGSDVSIALPGPSQTSPLYGGSSWHIHGQCLPSAPASLHQMLLYQSPEIKCSYTAVCINRVLEKEVTLGDTTTRLWIGT